jgi:hypothetical protein
MVQKRVHQPYSGTEDLPEGGQVISIVNLCFEHIPNIIDEEEEF